MLAGMVVGENLGTLRMRCRVLDAIKDPMNVHTRYWTFAKFWIWCYFSPSKEETQL